MKEIAVIVIHSVLPINAEKYLFRLMIIIIAKVFGISIRGVALPCYKLVKNLSLLQNCQYCILHFTYKNYLRLLFKD